MIFLGIRLYLNTELPQQQATVHFPQVLKPQLCAKAVL